MTYVENERRIKMPRRDGTGPIGMGPMTGRGFGFCGHRFYGRRNCFGRGFGPWYGAGYGFAPGYGQGYFKQDMTEKEFLKNQKEFLESQIELLEKELEDLKDD
jgi:hypothetical protein